MLHVFPIESLEERYSAQWFSRWASVLDQLGVSYQYCTGAGVGMVKIERGEFLDTIGTNIWKAEQLANFLRSPAKDDEWVLLHDAWNPQVASLAYVRDTEGPRFKIAGLLHAGTWDENDYLSRKGLGRWAKACEEGWLEALDLIFVATHYHKDLILKHRRCDPAKIRVTGFPFYWEDLPPAAHSLPWGDREKIVVFPHRLAAEKQPLQFAELEAMYRAKYGEDGSRWLMTKHECATKGDYYALLGSARCAVSTALQETWGIAMLEAMELGAAPVAPRRLSYPETMPEVSLYGTLDQAVEMIRTRLYAYDADASWGREGPWRAAISNMLKEMGLL